jgi:hypothetical protein
MAELNTIITLRQGTTSQWADSEVVLKSGEMGLEYLEDGSGLVKIKAGDGEHLWAALPYIGSDVKDANVFQVELTGDEMDSIAAIEAKVLAEGAEKQNGDVAIVKSTFADGKISYTSYVYDEELDVEGENSSYGWSAMDGNYSATNVFLKNKIELAGSFTSVGNYAKGKTIAAGTSLESLLSGMLQQELYPNANDKPNATISVSGGSGEVGSEYTVPTATLKIDDVGSYAYGDKATGITFAIGDVKLAEGADPATATNYKTNDAVMAKNSTITLKASGDKVLYTDSSKTYTFSASASYGAGKVPVTNLGNAYPSAQIPAGSVTIDDKTATFSGYRYAFAGGTTAATIDSAIVRSMSAKKSAKTDMDAESEALEFTAAAGATKVFFAYPATWTGTPYFEMFGLAWGQNTDIVAKDNIQVADYRGTNEDGTLNGATAYKLYAWELDTPLQAESTKFRVWFK